MNKKAVAFLLFPALVIMVTVSTVWSSPASIDSVTATLTSQYPVSSSPLNLVVESPGRIWFTLPEENAIGYLQRTSPSNFTFNKYPIGTANSEPHDLVYDDAYIWFTERAGNKLGRLNVATKIINEFSLPAANQEPAGIDVAPNGLIWFTARAGNRIYSFNPSTSQFTGYLYSSANGQPEKIAVLNDDAIWFTAPGVNRVVKLTPSTSDFLNVTVLLMPGGATFPPGGIDVDNRDPWISAPTRDLIGRHAPGTLAFWRWYTLHTSGGGPTDIVFRSANGLNQIWFVQTNAGRVGQLATDVNGEVVYIRELPLAVGSQPTSIAVDTNGHAWIAAGGVDQIVEWAPPYFQFAHLPIVLKP